MALTSALEPFLDQETSRKGFLEGRDDFPGSEVNLFKNSLLALTAQPASETYYWNGVKIPVDATGSGDPCSIPVESWSSEQKVAEAIREFLEANVKPDEEQEKLDAYDRAMSIL